MLKDDHFFQNNDVESAQNKNCYDSTPVSSNEIELRASFRYRTFRCPHCRTDISVTKADVGKIVTCPDCDMEITVPDYLDFDTETDYERYYFNTEKRRRDEVYSPLRNPNRVGIEIDDNNVYAVKDSDETSKTNYDDEVYYPVRCRICETLIQAPSSMLGKMVKCPDCGTETLVTDSLKRQQQTIDVRFQPREHGVYEIGEIPESPKIAFQHTNGRIELLDPSENSIAPVSRRQDSEKLSSKDEYFVPPIPSIDGNIHSEQSDSIDLKQGDKDVIGETSREKAQKYAELILKKDKSNHGARGFWKKWEEKRRRRLEEEERLENFMPPLVLRLKNGELVWALPSPPKRAPLYNGVLNPIMSSKIWSLAGLIGFLIFSIGKAYQWLSLPGKGVWDLFYGIFVWVFVGVGTICLSAIIGLYFWSVFNAGNSGARKVVEWRSESHPIDFVGYGIWFFFICASPLIISSIFCMFPDLRLASDEPLILHAVCFWALFPIFWTSTCQKDWFFCPINWNVFTSFFRRATIWIQFYLVTAVILAPLATLLLLVHNYVLLGASLVFPITVMFYALLLGRLSWILDDDVRNLEYDD